MISLCKYGEHAERLLQELIEAKLKPNRAIMISIMNVWIKSGRMDKATKVLDQMEDAYNRSDEQDLDVAPNNVSYNTLMNGWAKANNFTKAMEVFERMRAMYESGNEQAKPDPDSYRVLVYGISKDRQSGAAERIEKFVLDMYNEYKKGNFESKPNVRLVRNVITCWKNSGDMNAGERAEAMLNWLIDTYQKDGDKDFLPDSDAFVASKS